MYFLKRLLSLCFFIALLNSYTVVGQYDVIWAGAWQYGPADAVFLDSASHTAFLGSGGAVFIIDVSAPENPVLVNDDIRTNGFVRDIWYNQTDGNLYLACGRGGMEIWDVSEPDNPVRLSRTEILYFDAETPVEEIELYGDIAVLMCDWGYVHTVDITDPENPVQLHFNGQMGNPAHHIHVDAFGTIHATGAQFYVRLTLNDDGSLNNAGGKEFIYGAANLFGRENEAFVQYSGNMYILDLTLPGFPAWSITDVSFSDIVVRNDTVFLINEEGIELWDVSNVQAPVFIASEEIERGNELFLDGNLAYVSADHHGLYVIDISHPLDMQVIGQLPAYSWTPNFDMADGIGYAANGIGLYAVDMSNPYGSAPEAIDSIPTMGQTNDVAIMDNLAFVADWTGGLRIIDVADPGDMAELATVPIDAWRVTAGNGHVYATKASPNLPDTMKIYDVGNPASPVITASEALAEDAYDLEYDNSYVYVSNYNSGLKIIDVSDPYNPLEASSVNLPSVLDAAVDSSLLFIASADWDGGLVSVDISDPSNPSILQIYNPDGWFHPFHVDASWPFAYACDIYGDVYVFDVTDPSNMELLQTINLPGDILSIKVRDPYIYISDGQAGVQILENTLITSSSAESDMYTMSRTLKIYPNPSGKNVTIKVVVPEEGPAQAIIFNLQGEEVYRFGFQHLKKGYNLMHWNGSNQSGSPLPSGVYFYTVTHQSVTTSGKIILKHRKWH